MKRSVNNSIYYFNFLQNDFLSPNALRRFMSFAKGTYFNLLINMWQSKSWSLKLEFTTNYGSSKQSGRKSPKSEIRIIAKIVSIKKSSDYLNASFSKRETKNVSTNINPSILFEVFSLILLQRECTPMIKHFLLVPIENNTSIISHQNTNTMHSVDERIRIICNVTLKDLIMFTDFFYLRVNKSCWKDVPDRSRELN